MSKRTTIDNIRGMLLEEAVLYLLRVSGYKTVEKRDEYDDTLDGNADSGLKVLGRGGVHQIDAIADFVLAPPFTYAQRLLVEAKCYISTSAVGIDVIRSVIAIKKDIEEYWQTRDGIPIKSRYHYHHAVFSASRYTKEAEKLAFAHDIYLMPLAHSQFIQPILDSIRNITPETFGYPHANNIDLALVNLRRAVRALIKNREDDMNINILLSIFGSDTISAFQNYAQACRHVDKAFVAMIAKRFPIFLVPHPSLDLDCINDTYQVSIHWHENNKEKGWYIRSTKTNSILFSFDLPLELFNHYAENNMLAPESALNLKAAFLNQIQAISTTGSKIQIINLALDHAWLDQVRKTIKDIQEQ